MLHDRFGKRALVDMLFSATYWQALDRTSWMNYVPEGYYHAAQEKLEDSAMTEIPERWEPLPIKPAPGSPDSSLSWLYSSDDDEDDDKFDKTYHDQTTPSSGSASARSQSGTSGKVQAHRARVQQPKSPRLRLRVQPGLLVVPRPNFPLLIQMTA
ncbi:hypothetical protein PF003_g29545 [Phytophthora fragariae]|nr:hypothetical protein PF003_g29545 [Phytophthora fragariae]